MDSRYVGDYSGSRSFSDYYASGFAGCCWPGRNLCRVCDSMALSGTIFIQPNSWRNNCRWFMERFVIFGAHRALLPIGLNDVAITGTNTLMCFAGSANFAQAGASLGVMLKTKDKDLKQIAMAATIPAFLVGITEPAIYGCNLRLKKPMFCAVIAGAIGGAIMGLGSAVNTGFANNGILTIMTYYGEGTALYQFMAYLIGILVAFWEQQS